MSEFEKNHKEKGAEKRKAETPARNEKNAKKSDTRHKGFSRGLTAEMRRMQRN